MSSQIDSFGKSQNVSGAIGRNQFGPLNGEPLRQPRKTVKLEDNKIYSVVPRMTDQTQIKEFMRTIIEKKLNFNIGEKLISDNLIEGQQFERIEILPHSKDFIKLYENHSKLELSASRFSLYPKLITELENDIADIEAYNQFDEPEIISLKTHPFFVACGFCPQVSSTRELPHPIIYTFMKACQAMIDTPIAKQA